MTREEAIAIIERVQHTDAKWPGTEDTLEALDLAAAALSTLQTENEKLRADLARVTAERDAAIADWRGFCAKCAWNGKQYLADGKMDDRCRTCRENGKCNWKWRGIKKED